MKNWKSWLAVTALSLGLVGCGANIAQDSAYHGAGTNGYRGMAADDRAGWNMNPANPNATADMNDLGTRYPGAYNRNSIYQDRNNMGVRTKSNYQMKNYGYSIYTKRDMNPQQASTFYVDRNVLARAVSTVVTSIPGVEKANILVTDEDLFVGLPGVKNKSTINKAKLSAWSMSPRYYKIYVTGDQKVINQVNALVNQTGSKNISLDHLDRILTNGNLTDMTGTNVTDNGQNTTNYNLNQTYPNTNGTHRMNNR